MRDYSTRPVNLIARQCSVSPDHFAHSQSLQTSSSETEQTFWNIILEQTRRQLKCLGILEGSSYGTSLFPCKTCPLRHGKASDMAIVGMYISTLFSELLRHQAEHQQYSASTSNSQRLPIHIILKKNSNSDPTLSSRCPTILILRPAPSSSRSISTRQLTSPRFFAPSVVNAVLGIRMR
jgi:hypothetical protein